MNAVVETFGPFLIPVVLFALGVIGYGVLVVLSRWGVFQSDEPR